MRNTLSYWIEEVFRALGDPTELSPYVDNDGVTIDIASKGYQLIRNALNLGQQQVAFYKNPANSRQFRWKDGYKTLRVRYVPTTVTVDFPNGLGQTQVNISGLTSNPQDLYLQFDGDLYYVQYTTLVGGVYTCWLDTAHTLTAGDSVSGLLCQNWVLMTDLDVVVDVAEVLRVGTLNGATFSRSPRSAEFGEAEKLNAGTPTQWYKKNKRVYFDVVLTSETFLRFDVIVPPTVVTNPSDYFSIPPQFEGAIYLWALGWGYGLKQEFDVQKKYRNDFHEFMMQTQSEDDMYWNLDEDYGISPQLN